MFHYGIVPWHSPPHRHTNIGQITLLYPWFFFHSTYHLDNWLAVWIITCLIFIFLTNQERQQQETLLSTWKVLSGSSRSMPSIPNISVCTVKESGLIGPLCPGSIGVSLMMKMKALVLGLRNEIYSFSQPLSILFTPKGVLQAFLHLHLLTPLWHFIKHTITYLSSRFRAQRVFWCFLPSTYS